MKRLSVFFLVISAFLPCAYAEPLTWDDVRYGGVVEQRLDNSCGLSSLLTLMIYHFGDERYDERQLLTEYVTQASEQELGIAMRDGLSLLELSELAQSVGYTTRLYQLEREQLGTVVAQVPVLVYLEVKGYRHFAVVRRTGNRVELADPARGVVDHSWTSFLDEWIRENDKGYAMIIVP